MDNLQGRLVIFLVGLASIFLILFGIRGSASIINPILLAAVITITVLPVPSCLTRRGIPGWLTLLVTILMVVLLLSLVIATVFFAVTRLSSELPKYLSIGSAQANADLAGGGLHRAVRVRLPAGWNWRHPGSSVDAAVANPDTKL